MRTKPPRPASQTRIIYLAVSAVLYTVVAVALITMANILILVPNTDYTPGTHAILGIGCLVMTTAGGLGFVANETARDCRYARTL